MSDPTDPDSAPQPGAPNIDADEVELRALLSPLLDAQETEALPVGFSDRVLASLDDTVAPVPKSAPRASAVVAAFIAAAAAACAVFVWDRFPAPTGDGAAVLAVNEEVRLASRGIAVAQTDARLKWKVAASGAATVDQESGRVFYRVSPRTQTAGRALVDDFVVHTPGGDVHVTGTCFSVEVNPMLTTQQSTLLNKGKLALGGAIAGAILTGGLLVTVFEGHVDVRQKDGVATTLRAGETALAGANHAPVKIQAKLASLENERAFLTDQRGQLRDQVSELEAQLKTVMIASANGEDPRAAENKLLREELADVRNRLRAYEKDSDKRQGQAVEWPENIDPIFQEDHVKTSVLESIRAAGLSGDVDSIDCTEFPCMAFGEIVIEGDREDSAREMKKFNQEMDTHFPDKGVSRSNSVWGKSVKGKDGVQRQRNNFGISFYPDDAIEGEESQKALSKRLRFRANAYTDSLVE